jgi:hypothetical protein
MGIVEVSIAAGQEHRRGEEGYQRYSSAGIDAAGTHVVSHAGVVLLTETIAVVGLDTVLSGALAGWRPRLAVHDPPKVVLDLRGRVEDPEVPARVPRPVRCRAAMDSSGH